MNKDVLLVEDEDGYRETIKRLFRNSPYRIIEAEGPEEAIRILGDQPELRVVLLDLSFPNSASSARNVLDFLKKRQSESRVIILTAHQEKMNAEQAAGYAVFNYLEKAGEKSEAVKFSLQQAFADLELARLNHKLHLMLEVQQRISSGQELKRTLDLICAGVLDCVEGYTCHIRVYDFLKGDYHLAGFAGHPAMRRIFTTPKGKGDLFSGRVIESGVAEAITDLQHTREFREVADQALARPNVSAEENSYFGSLQSAYLVPISTGIFENLKVEAVMNVSSSELAYFTPDRQETVREFANQASMAIARDWLNRKRGEIHDDYSQIAGVLSDISQISDRPDEPIQRIYETVTSKLAEIVNAEVVSVFLFNELTQMLENVAEFRGDKHVQDWSETYRPGRSLTGRVFKSKNALRLPGPGDPPVLEDSRYEPDDKDVYHQLIPSRKLEHYLGVPIYIAGQVRGVLRAMNKKSQYYRQSVGNTTAIADVRGQNCLLDRGFSSDCQNDLEITATHLGIAIRNAELIRDKQQQVEQVKTLGEVGRLINAEMSLDESLVTTIEEMKKVMQAEICMLFVRERDEQRVVLKQSAGMPLIEGATYDFGEGVTGAVAKTLNARLIQRTDHNNGKYDAQIRSFLQDKHQGPKEIESLMVVPIVGKAKLLGVMKVINKTGPKATFGASDLEFFKTFGRYVGIAIENAERSADLFQMVKVAAHEIRNTSGVIPANVDAIREELDRPSRAVSEMLDLIEENANQATDFANEITGFATPNQANRRELEVSAQIREIVERMTAEAHSEGGKLPTIETRLSRPALVCDVYPRQFEQLVRNLVLNACQALEGRKRAKIQISTRRTGREAVLEFADNGPGIKLEHLPKVFNPGFTTKPRGSGVGLWLVKKHVELLNGRITADNGEVSGAVFTVTLPLATPETTAG